MERSIYDTCYKECIKFGIFETKRTVHIIEMPIRKGYYLFFSIICSIIIYFDVDDGTVESFDPPLLFNVEVDPEEKTPLPNQEYRQLLANISDALIQHMSTRRNKWLSQLDSRIIPFWFPCANFPHCFQKSDETSDFSDLFNL